MAKRYPPDDPREWLNRVRSNLARAKAKRKDVYLEDLCFDAQQAAEKAIKALLIKLAVNFPYVHDLAELLTLVEKAGQAVPERIKRGQHLVVSPSSPDTQVLDHLLRRKNINSPLRSRNTSSRGRKK